MKIDKKKQIKTKKIKKKSHALIGQAHVLDVNQ